MAATNAMLGLVNRLKSHDLVVWLGGKPPGFHCCSTATEQQKFTVANYTSCVEVLSLGVIARPKARRPSTIPLLITA
jgi:hypothetical protein